MDDDEDERENFEITDWDLQNEFNPNRQRHWQTKEEATYGVWAERDSDEERPSFGGKRYGWGMAGADRFPQALGSYPAKYASLLASPSPLAVTSAKEPSSSFGQSAALSLTDHE